MRKSLITDIIIVLLLFTGCTINFFVNKDNEKLAAYITDIIEPFNINSSNRYNNSDNTYVNEDTDFDKNKDNYIIDSDNYILEVHALDVGQALSVLIKDEYGNELLYDTGNINDGEYIVQYLTDKNVDEIEYLINSHPHEDHIGGMAKVIENFEIDTVIMSNKIATTNVYENTINSIESKNLSITKPSIGETFKLGNAYFQILGPFNTNYEDTNNYSIIIKVMYKDQSILLTGDAESLVEHELIEKKVDLTADILQIGHHGSISSSTANFLYEVNPEYAFISVGEDNKYGHPDPIVINRLENMGINTFRTDLDGTIIFVLDGQNIEVLNER